MEIGEGAFYFCTSLTDAEFGNKLETIGQNAFYNCLSLRNIKMPTVRTIAEPCTAPHLVVVGLASARSHLFFSRPQPAKFAYYYS